MYSICQVFFHGRFHGRFDKVFSSLFRLYFVFSKCSFKSSSLFRLYHTFLPRGMLPKFRIVYLPEIRAPAGASQTQGSFSELTSTKLIHFHRNLKDGFSPIFVFLVTFYLIPRIPLKIKMVRMVHRNLFYSTELKICDAKSELWRETEK